MDVKHWFKVALMLQGDGDAQPSVRGVQRVYVDKDNVMFDLANIFVNLGVPKLTPKIKAFILRNSRVVAMEPMMIEPAKVAGVLMEAFATGLLPDVTLQQVQEYILDLTNHVSHSALSAYAATNADIFAEDEVGDAE